MPSTVPGFFYEAFWQTTLGLWREWVMSHLTQISLPPGTLETLTSANLTASTEETKSNSTKATIHHQEHKDIITQTEHKLETVTIAEPLHNWQHAQTA